MTAAQRLASLADRIDQVLPQTQCRQCGYTGCQPYAEAIAAGSAGINQCPPGGEGVINDLAALLGVPVVGLDSVRGAHKPPAVAVIDEAACIGCAVCIQACPVDAIVGAARFMHTVIAAQCTGCELCIPPCPVDCIHMTETGSSPTREEQLAAAAGARRRYLAHNERLARVRAEQSARRATVGNTAEEKKRLTVKRAVERAQARLKRHQTGSRKP